MNQGDYFILMDGKVDGPHSFETLCLMWKEGKIDSEAYYSQPTMEEWQKISQIQDLFENVELKRTKLPPPHERAVASTSIPMQTSNNSRQVQRKLKPATLVGGVAILLLLALWHWSQPKPASNKSTEESEPRSFIPSTIELDRKNGFRDVFFGQNSTSITNIKFANRWETSARRDEDELSIDGVPLKSIVYSFFQDRLVSVELEFNISHSLKKDNLWINQFHYVPDWPIGSTGQSDDCSTRLKGFIEHLYGKPSTETSELDTWNYQGNSYVAGKKWRYAWIGSKVRIDMEENNRNPGLGMTPTSSGRITIKSIPIALERQNYFLKSEAQNARLKRDGL